MNRIISFYFYGYFLILNAYDYLKLFFLKSNKEYFDILVTLIGIAGRLLKDLQFFYQIIRL